jgi:hypothetical protein
VYKNIHEDKNKKGLYPFESIKDIERIVSSLGYAPFTAEQGKIARDEILAKWKAVRIAILDEFDRAEPSVRDNPYV